MHRLYIGFHRTQANEIKDKKSRYKKTLRCSVKMMRARAVLGDPMSLLTYLSNTYLPTVLAVRGITLRVKGNA
jgi:hypothetical protein